MDRVLRADSRGKRQIGMGMIGRIFARRFRHSIKEDPDVREQLDDFDDYRPYFTYWVCTVQVIVCIVSMAVYGIAPIGFAHTHHKDLVLTPSLAVEPVGYMEPDNFWIGPKSQALIHLGAKYSPCMRQDSTIFEKIWAKRTVENSTACCIRNDGGGCIQTTKNECSDVFSRWTTWFNGGNLAPEGRTRGSVCGQDPRNCKEPPSSGAHEWPDDLTKWPICRETQIASRQSVLDHVSCNMIGRPCCTGIKGECVITTRDYCDFVSGYFHEEATLCSQVSCLDEICGMIPFMDADDPDQFYRLWTSLFLHAGLIHVLISVTFQMLLMRDLEKLMGCVRIGIIYIMSGIAGNLASAIFLPYRAEVGPAGSQFGLIATFFVEVLQSWQMLKHPWFALLKLTGVFLLLLAVGFLPWIDNYSHSFGFIFGFLLAFALLPYVSFGEFDRTRKKITVGVAILSAAGLFALLLILFYVAPLYDCESCGYFNCLPFSETFCQNFEIKIN